MLFRSPPAAHDRGGGAHGQVPHVRDHLALDFHAAGTQVDEDGGDVDLDLFEPY